jgi:hypothetical protein
MCNKIRLFTTKKPIPFVGIPLALFAIEEPGEFSSSLFAEGFIFWVRRSPGVGLPTDCGRCVYDPASLQCTLFGKPVIDYDFALDEMNQWAYGSIQGSVLSVYEGLPEYSPFPTFELVEANLSSFLRSSRDISTEELTRWAHATESEDLGNLFLAASRFRSSQIEPLE